MLGSETNSATLGEVAAPSSYLERKAAGLCTRGRCDQPLAMDADGQPVSQLCERHRRERLAQDARDKMRRRAVRREQGLCAECPARSRTYYCPACALRLGRIPRGAVGRPRQIAVQSQSLTPDSRLRIDSDGRMRFHGRERRGRLTAEADDDLDLSTIDTDAARAKAAWLVLRQPEIRALPRDQRLRVKQEAAAWLEHLARTAVAMLARHGLADVEYDDSGDTEAEQRRRRAKRRR